MALAALYLCLHAAALSLGPVVRTGDWAQAGWDHWLGFGLWLGAVILAHFESSRRLPGRDPYLLPLAALLSGLGMLSIWRLLPALGLRQAVWFAFSLGLLVIGLRLPSRLDFLRRYKYLWLTGSLLLTGATLLFGVNPLGYGPRMWLGCCGVYLQPSEPLKLLLIGYLAGYLADQRLTVALAAAERQGTRWLALVAPALVMVGLALLVLLVQRDLGTASILIFLFAVLVYLATDNLSIPLLALAGILLAGAAGYLLYDVVQVRVNAWINPWLDPSGGSYQIVQSLIAVANGGLLGRGPGLGNPWLVPVAHSDLIYAAVAEEQGLLGAAGLLLAVALLAGRGLRAAARAGDPYRRYLAAGLTAYLAGQALLIVGGSLHLLPLTGVTLPFVAYGGSSMLTSVLALLLLLHLSAGTDRPYAPAASRPLLQLAVLLLVGLAAVTLATGWWSLARSASLLARTDNARRSIDERLVRRGALLDSRYRPVNASEPGDAGLQRIYLAPELSSVTGYNHPTYGLSGLEATLDDYLRGVQGNPPLQVILSRLLYGHPPPGLDMRLSLDLDLQRQADALLGGHKGALVALDARSGAILAMASHPTFDANRLEQEWDALIQDPDAPLLNRATFGRYPAGALAGGLFDLKKMGLVPAPLLHLPGGELPGQSPLMFSPLQMALAAAAVSSGGVRPAPWIVAEMKTPQAGWVPVAPLDEPYPALTADQALSVAASRRLPGQDIWQAVEVVAPSTGDAVTWFLGGTLPAGLRSAGQTANLPELALVVLLEDEDPTLAGRIGRELLATWLKP